MQHESYLYPEHFDLVTPDGLITKISPLANGTRTAEVLIENISEAFVGYQIDKTHVFFNLKSTLAQLGINAIKQECTFDKKRKKAHIKVLLEGYGPIAQAMLVLLEENAYIGKLFAADERRRVRNPEYLLRMFGRVDREGEPLLSLGGEQGSKDLLLEKVDSRAVAYLSLQKGIITYDKEIMGFLPTIAKALKSPKFRVRSYLKLHQMWNENTPRLVEPQKILLVKTYPLHIRTVFGKVVEEFLPKGFHHTSASVLEPDTLASGDIYELYGNSEMEINDIPLEFYTLEPHREHVFFADRDQLQLCIEDASCLFKAFETAPEPIHHGAAMFIVKSDQLLNLQSSDWIAREPHTHEFPGLHNPSRQALMVDRYIQQQPSYPFLKAIETGLISSQGILLSRYFPSPLMKKLLLSDTIQKSLKGIYFQYPSRAHGNYFSHEDRSMLLDLAKFGIPVFWLDKTSGKMLQYIPKPDKDAGMFVPLSEIDTFVKATSFGIYGSNLVEGNFEEELYKLLKGIQALSKEVDHPLLNSTTPIALITGGGPGVMEVGNRVAKNAGILSCANIVDFRVRGKTTFINEQKQNPFIDAKMTYRLDRLVERQAEFNLDFPIFLIGGIGTDFEFSLEEVRRKVGSSTATPVLLFGKPEYWREKITSRFLNNLENGTIQGSEWVSNCFFCVTNAEEALEIYKQFFKGTLPIGKESPLAKEGFVILR